MTNLSKLIVALSESRDMSWMEKARLISPELAIMCDAFNKSKKEGGSQAFISKTTRLHVLKSW